MLQDFFRKKTKKPPAHGDAPLETTDLKDRIPDIDQVLNEVNDALEKADRILRQIRSKDNCKC